MRLGGAVTFEEWAAVTGWTPPQPAGGRAPMVAEVFEVLSSDKVTIYHVRRYVNGVWTCECLGFKYRGFCRHIGKYQQEQRG